MTIAKCIYVNKNGVSKGGEGGRETRGGGGGGRKNVTLEAIFTKIPPKSSN